MTSGVFVFVASFLLYKVFDHGHFTVTASSDVYVDSQCGSDRTCCWLQNATCDIEFMEYENSTVIFPGGETRCIASTSTDYAFEVLPISLRETNLI